MKGIKQIVFLLTILLNSKMVSQPFVDLASFNIQSSKAAYKSNSSWENKTLNYTINLFYPKELKNKDVLLFRMNAEKIQSEIYIPDTKTTTTSIVSSVTLAIGYQWISESKKWKTTFLAIPKIASDFKEPISKNDWQYGVFFLENYTINKKLKLKTGLYYNKEAFGNFFVPLLGLDWKANDRLNLYGTLPGNYQIEYALAKDNCFTGLSFKTFTRSFQLSSQQKSNYVRYDEMLLKAFIEKYVYKKFLLFAEVGYSFGKSPLQYTSETNELNTTNPVYTRLKNYPFFNVGLAYRVRLDSDKNK